GVRDGSREQGDERERAEQTEPAAGLPQEDEIAVGDGVRCGGGGAGQVLERRADGKLVVAMGAMKMVVDPDQATRTAAADRAPAEHGTPHPTATASEPSALEIDLRGMTGDEAE